MKYRKKPIIIEAVQLSTFDNDYTKVIPRWLMEALTSGVIFYRNDETFIKTLEGEHVASRDDYIIRGIKGELYPCKPDIFEATYEAVNE